MTTRKRSKVFETAQASLQEGRLEGIIDGPKSGRWGKWKYCMRGKTQYCQPFVKPQDPRTAAQMLVREALKTAGKAWGGKLTQEQRDAWNKAAKQELSKPRLVPGAPLLGEESFVKHGAVLLRIGKELPLWPTPRPVFKANPVAGLIVTNGWVGVRIKLLVSGPVEEDVMVLAQAPCSAGRKKWRRGAYLCLLRPSTGGEIDLTAEYVARFGEPEPGQKVFIRTQQQRDGWKDIPKDLSEIVPVRAEATEVRRKNAECRMQTAETVARSNVWLNGLKRLAGLNKVPGLNNLRWLDAFQQANARGDWGRRKGGRMYKGVVPCRYRVNTVSIPVEDAGEMAYRK